MTQEIGQTDADYSKSKAPDGPLADSPPGDRNLLFGVIALGMEFIGRDSLVASMQEWSRDQTRPLGEVLVARGELSAEHRKLVDELVENNVFPRGADELPSAAAQSGDVNLARTTNPDGSASIDFTTEVSKHVRESKQHAHRPSHVAADTRYHIIKRHATGGLGEVFIALDTELHREVALKEIQRDHAHNPASRERFLREAEITGSLEHPGIVPIYGLGIRADGRAFYAMRFIQGDNLKEAIARFHEADLPGRDRSERRLALRALLRRFIDVCNAVAYAHSRGVLHRDLKPANVMLGVYGETLVVDWGLAKAGIGEQSQVGERELGEDETPTPRLFSGDTDSATQVGSAIGTPGFMSPEQAAGRLDDIAPTSDVYSLGATLYYLLAGNGPFRHLEIKAALERTQTGDFPKPSQVKPNVPRTLEAVCLKAMATQREDRYQSARDLADDIEHWFADEPTAAYREPWPARFARWSRRHRPVVAAIAALLLTAVVALTVGLFAVDRERARTQEEKERAETALASEEAARKRTRQALDDMTSQVTENWMARKGKLDPAQEAFLVKALASYEEFGRETGDREEARRGIADAHVRVGRIYYKLGRVNAAETAFRRAEEHFDGLTRDFPSEPEHRRELAGSHHNLGVVLVESGRAEEGEVCYRKALDIRKQLIADFPTEPRYRKDLAINHNLLGNVLANRGKRKDAEAVFQEAVSIQKQLIADYPKEWKYRSDLAITYYNLGGPLKRLNRFQDSEAAYRESLALRRQLAEDFPTQPDHRKSVADTLESLGDLLSTTGQLKEAEDAFREAVTLHKRLADEFPAVAAYRDELASSHQSLAEYLETTDRPQEAEVSFQAAVALEKQLVADHPSVTAFRENLARAHVNLGVFLYKRGRLAEAEAAYRESLAIKKQLVADFPAIPGYRNDAVQALYNLALLLKRTDRNREAEEGLRDCIAQEEQLVREYPTVPRYRLVLAMCHGALGSLLGIDQLEEAEAAYREALAGHQKLVIDFPKVPQYRQELSNTQRNLGELLKDGNRPEQASTALTAAKEGQEKLISEFSNISHYRFELALTLNLLAELKRNAREFSEGRSLLEQAKLHLDGALIANPDGPNYRRTFRANRALQAQVFAGLGDHDAAVRTAEEISKLGWDQAIDFYDSACALARCACVINDDPNRPDAERQKHAAAFNDRAVQCLKEAIAKGYNNVDKLRKDKDLDLLRSRDDFQLLVTALADKVKPDSN